VYSHHGTITMRGGTITGNTARRYGGGIYANSGTLSKGGGTITGYSSDQSNGNVVKDDAGIMARRGHAVWIGENLRKETTAGPGVNLVYSTWNTTGAWDR